MAIACMHCYVVLIVFYVAAHFKSKRFYRNQNRPGIEPLNRMQMAKQITIIVHKQRTNKSSRSFESRSLAFLDLIFYTLF